MTFLYTSIIDNFPWIVPILRLLASRSKSGDSVDLLRATALNIVEIRRQSDHPGKVYIEVLIYCN